LSASDGTGKGVLIAGPACGPKPALQLQPAQPRLTFSHQVLRLALAKAAAAVKEASPDWEAGQ
jgi:hypothetical protein